MDAGVGEAMAISALIGAGVGGASSAATGQDPLKGALIGGLGGAVTGGAMGAFGGAGTAVGEAGLSAASVEATQLGEEAARKAVEEAVANGVTDQTTKDAIAQSAREYASNTAGNASMGYKGIPMLDQGAALPPSVPNAAGLQPTGGIAGAQASGIVPNGGSAFSQPLSQGAGTFGQGFYKGIADNATPAMVGGAGILGLSAINADKNRFGTPAAEHYEGPLKQFKYDPNTFKATYPTPPNPAYEAQYQNYRTTPYAEGGITNLNPSIKQIVDTNRDKYERDTANSQQPDFLRAMHDTVSRFENMVKRPGGMAKGGIAGLLKGRGDGMSDSIRATIADKQPARLADGEFVVPADVVSHLGNGSTDAGAKHLYKMMDKVRTARTGNKKQGRQIAAGGYLPA